MRIRPALALLVLAACDSSDGSQATSVGAPAVATPQTRDQLLLRARRTGGAARVLAYPRTDSVIWTAGMPMPAISRTLAFDQEAGTLAFVDTKGIPRFLDLRTGETSQGAPTLRAVASRDAWNVYGVAADGQVVRATPAAQGAEGWRFEPPARAAAVYPQSDGSILIAARAAGTTPIWRLFPPDAEIVDSITLPPSDTLPVQIGDRLYVAVDSGLVGVRGRGRTLQLVPPIEFERRIRSVVGTPSGDRFFVATDSSTAIHIVNVYRDEISGQIPLPGQPGMLRMDPYGRALIARPVSGDSAWIVSLASNRIIGSVRTAWRNDLPLVAPDGSVMTVVGRDVVVLDGATLQQTATVRFGGDDFWHFFEWGGFRPRAAGIDEPVSFESIGIPDSTTFGLDTLGFDTLGVDSLFIPPATLPLPPTTVLIPPRDSGQPPPGRLPPVSRPPTAGFSVSFATLLDQARAEELAREIRVDGRSARVMSSVRDGTPLHRVVLGPYPTREEAERAGRTSGRPYWVYEGNP